MRSERAHEFFYVIEGAETYLLSSLRSEVPQLRGGSVEGTGR